MMDYAVPILDSKQNTDRENIKAHRRSVRTERRRAEILDAAKQIFLNRDFGSVTIEEIADAAAFSRATIYLYFKSKQEVYTGILLRDLDSLIGGVQDSFNSDDTVRNNLFRMATSYMNYFRVHPEYFITHSFFFFPGRQDTLPPEAAKMVEKRLAEGMTAVENAIRLGIERGEARSVDARAATLSLWGQWMGIAYLTIAGQVGVNGRTMEQVYSNGIELFLEGVTARG